MWCCTKKYCPLYLYYKISYQHIIYPFVNMPFLSLFIKIISPSNTSLHPQKIVWLRGILSLSDLSNFCLAFVLFFNMASGHVFKGLQTFVLFVLLFLTKLPLLIYLYNISLYFFTINFMKNSKTSKTNRYRPVNTWPKAILENKTNPRHV